MTTQTHPLSVPPESADGPGRFGRRDLCVRIARSADPRQFFSLGAWLPELRTIGDRQAVALTFDDGPAPETTPALLDTLRRHASHATFFLSGVRAVARPDLVEAIARDGHDVYGHGWEHSAHEDGNPAATVEAVDRCERLLAKIRPTPSPYLVRLPYTAGHRSSALHRALARWRADVQFVHYSATLHDWLIALDCESREQVMRRVAMVLRRASAAPLGGRILLLHDQPIDADKFGVSRTLGAAATVALAEGLLRVLRDRGLATARLRPSPVQSAGSKVFLPPRLGMVRIGPW